MRPENQAYSDPWLLPNRTSVAEKIVAVDNTRIRAAQAGGATSFGAVQQVDICPFVRSQPINLAVSLIIGIHTSYFLDVVWTPRLDYN